MEEEPVVLNQWGQLSEQSSEDDVTSNGLTEIGESPISPAGLRKGVQVGEFLGEAERTGRTPTAK